MTTPIGSGFGVVIETCTHCSGGCFITPDKPCEFCMGSGRMSRPVASAPSDIGGPDAQDLETDELRRQLARARELIASTEAQVAGLIRERDHAREYGTATRTALYAAQATRDDLRARLEASEKLLHSERTGVSERHKGILLKLDASERGAAAMKHFCEWAWTIIANAGGGNWKLEHADWQEAARKWADGYHALASDAGRDYVPRAEMAVEIDRLLENEERLQVRAHNAAIEKAADLAAKDEHAEWLAPAIRALRQPSIES